MCVAGYSKVYVSGKRMDEQTGWSGGGGGGVDGRAMCSLVREWNG